MRLKINKTHIIMVARRLGCFITPQEAQNILDEVMPDAKKIHRDKDYMNKVVDILTEKLNKQRMRDYDELEKK
jgi:hypothetical protein